MLANLLASSVYSPNIFPSNEFVSGSTFNADGYFEEIGLTLLNDQIIRLTFGAECSNLFLPNTKTNSLTESTRRATFHYDLDESTIRLPENFSDKVLDYTGTTWDVWGLSRMQPGQKWYKAYSKFGVSTGKAVVESIETYSRSINQSETPLVIKDPRLSLTLDEFSLDPCKNKVIWLAREPEAVMNSMRKHYGKNLFTEETLPGIENCVSNHFNYRIGPQSFEQYQKIYNSALSCNVSPYETLSISYESILSGGALDKLEEFAECKLDKTRIKREQNHFSL